MGLYGISSKILNLIGRVSIPDEPMDIKLIRLFKTRPLDIIKT